jgi:uncharacterized membrane protein YhiD involved in acid resistance
MDQLDTFQNFIVSHSGEVSLQGLAVNIVISAVLCAILGWFYIKYGTTLASRRSLAKIFVIIGVTTTLVITVIKASLALSLGLVGALSIVRFRAAIKEPEELAFLFLTIAIGLGLGADQRAVTIIALILILASFLIYRWYTSARQQEENFFLTVTADVDADASSDVLQGVIEVLEEECATAVLRRYEKRKLDVEMSFLVEVQCYKSLARLNERLGALPGNPKFAFVEDFRVL